MAALILRSRNSLLRVRTSRLFSVPIIPSPQVSLIARRYQSDSPATSNGTPKLENIQETGLNDGPAADLENSQNDWSRSFHGLSTEPFPKEVAAALNDPINPEDIEIKPDGIIYLPEIKYRRILNKAFGPGGWGLAPRGESIVTDKVVTREYALICHGRLVSVARGEQQYFDPSGIPTATEGCKSNALMRTCKDLGIAWNLWDPRFIRSYKKEYCEEKFAEHVLTKKKRKLWKKKGDSFEYPYKLTSF